jgi:glutathione S-transferase
LNVVLYQFPAACSRVTLNALEEIGLPYELHTLNMRAADHQSAEYLAINPKGKIPAISFDGRILTESPAILYALHRSHPATGLLPITDGFPDEYQGLSDLIWCGSGLHSIVRQVRMPSRYTRGDSSGVAADGAEKMAKECKALNERLGDGRWWYGERWSIVDVYLYWCYSTAAKGGFLLDRYPELLAHAMRVRARPSFQRALAAEIASVHSAHIDIPVEQL